MFVSTLELVNALITATGAVVAAASGETIVTSIAGAVTKALGTFDNLCDGVVVGDVLFLTPTNITQLSNGTPVTYNFHDPGSGSPVGCGSNSDYYTNAILQRLNPTSLSIPIILPTHSFPPISTVPVTVSVSPTLTTSFPSISITGSITIPPTATPTTTASSSAAPSSATSIWISNPLVIWLLTAIITLICSLVFFT